MGRCGVKMPNM